MDFDDIYRKKMNSLNQDKSIRIFKTTMILCFDSSFKSSYVFTDKGIVKAEMASIIFLN